MPATLPPPPVKVTTHTVAGHTFSLPDPGGVTTLQNVSYSEFVAIDDHFLWSALRMTFNHGVLEIELPSTEHEEISTLINLAVAVFCAERGRPCRSTASSRWGRESDDRGLESDESFYIRSASIVEGREIDLEVDPPPDLAVEIDISPAKPSRAMVYTTLGVPEIWIWRDQNLTVTRLIKGRYQTVDQSVELPDFPHDLLTHTLRRWPRISQNVLITDIMQWCRDNPAD
jgi:Uma2 family endonuclease